MAKVFFSKNPEQVDKLFDESGISKVISKDDFVALKIHFGERGNKAFVNPQRAKPIVKKVRAAGGKPFWIDANTLYTGSRRNTLDHLQTAFDHGYTFGKTGAHVIIADGIHGKTFEKVPVNYKHFKTLYVGALIFEANAMIAVTHFKGHELTGFGGALKNIGMGLGSPRGKLDMHSDCKNCPEVKTCRKKQNFEACWFGSSLSVQEKMVEYTGGIVEKFKNKTAYISFITDVSPNCDCYDHNGPPIVPDIGILASFDPVAIDQASVDLVNKSAGKDIFKELWPKADWKVQLQYAEEIGLGSRKYELIAIE